MTPEQLPFTSASEVSLPTVYLPPYANRVTYGSVSDIHMLSSLEPQSPYDLTPWAAGNKAAPAESVAIFGTSIPVLFLFYTHILLPCKTG